MVHFHLLTRLNGSHESSLRGSLPPSLLCFAQYPFHVALRARVCRNVPEGDDQLFDVNIKAKSDSVYVRACSALLPR
jgi:hypothetical protein